jgi:hypothetical protein
MNTVRLVMGWIMIALASGLLAHLVWTRGTPITPSIWLDLLAMTYCLLRGYINLRSWRARRVEREA